MISTFLILILCSLASARADILKQQEPKYSLAVIAYNEKKYQESLKILNELLRDTPGSIEFLELKALALKTAKNDSESASTYESLIQAKSQAGAPQKELAPYQFELGVIRFRSKEKQAAIPLFEAAIRSGFNTAPASFFLGMIHFEAGRNAEAVIGFKTASDSNLDEIAAPAAFYLGQAQLKIGESGAATSSFVNAKLLARSLAPKSPSAKNIVEACDRILAPLDRAQNFGSIAIATAYDSNVQALPDQAEGVLNINQDTFKTLVQAGIGRMSSPTENFQWIPSYRMAYNKNFNSDTREGEFLSQELSLFLNHRPLDPSNYGFKIDLGHTFQNQFDRDNTDNSTFRQFSATSELEAYYRFKWGKSLGINLSAAAGPQLFFGDMLLPRNERRTGLGWNLASQFTLSSRGKWLNPAMILGLSGIDSGETDFHSATSAILIQNGLLFSDRTRGFLSVGVSDTRFKYRQGGERSDQNFSLGLQLNHQLGPRWSVTADGSISRNISSVSDTYQYFRWTMSTGVNYSLF
jgi:tetratricopeptide (TPR) repeat protein